MKLIPGLCPQCGAILSVIEGTEAMVCNYCNTPFVCEKAINKFNNTYTIINNINAQNVFLQNVTSDFEIIAGELVNYRGTAKDIVIPDNVEKIKSKCFEQKNIRKRKIVSTFLK